MIAKVVWKEKMKFTAESEGHSLDMDAKPPFGNGEAPTPKELVAMAVGGCTGMDVAALMRKYKQPMESLEITVDAPPVEKVQPPIFKEIAMVFHFKGAIDAERALEAVRLSQTKFCAVSAMLAASVPIRYKVVLNDEEIGSGEANFAK